MSKNIAMLEELAGFYPLKRNLRVKEVANFFGISDTQIKILCREQKIQATKIGGVWCIPRKALEDFIQSNHNKYYD